MNRYKFRAKREDNGKWVYGSLSNFDEQSGYVYILEPFIQASTLPVFTLMKENLHLVDKRTVGQYTGWQDKNGVDIYEGDIVRFEVDDICTKPFYINYDIHDCSFSLFRKGIVDRGLLAHYSKDIAVIGNIYENKELLEN